MSKLQALIDRIDDFENKRNKIVQQVFVNIADDFMAQVRAQLLTGKTAKGEDIHPYYTEDLKSNGGYFDSEESARRYVLWKRGKFGVNPTIGANLFIDGTLHDSLFLSISEAYSEVASSYTSSSMNVPEIIVKYNAMNDGEVFKPNAEWFEAVFKPEFVSRYRTEVV